jgi:CheY-like chemotaxis protein
MAPFLIVEDSAEDAMLFSMALEEAGLRNPLVFTTSFDDTVSFFGGGGKYADRQLYPITHTIFVDVRLPGYSGLELLAWLRVNDSTREAKVIMMSGSVSPIERERAFAMGANFFLEKPVTTLELIESLKQLRSALLLNAS